MARRGSVSSASRTPGTPLHMNLRRRRVQQPTSPLPPTRPLPRDGTAHSSSLLSLPHSSPPPQFAADPRQLSPFHEAAEPPSRTKRKQSCTESKEASSETTPTQPKKRAKTAKILLVDEGYDSNNDETPVTPPLEERLVPRELIYYGTDGRTRFRGQSSQATPAPSSPQPAARRGRGGRGGRGRGRGGRQTNGISRSRFKPEKRERDDESPDPTPKKASTTEDERAYVARLKARQQELKNFFQTVGKHQVDALMLLVSRDLGKLSRKAKAHKKVPEYEEVMQDLIDRRNTAVEMARTRYKIELGHAEDLLVTNRDAIERQYVERVDHVQREHLKGAEGEILLLKQAHCAAKDDTRTETASEIDFPTYHPAPPPGRIRGYNSSRITDETAFRHQYTNFSDQVRQEVINSDVISPVERAFKEREERLREEKARRKTMNIDTLSEEAARELQNMKGYLLPRQMHSSEMNSFALSGLADAAEWMAQKHPQKQYIYHPLPPNTHYPAHGLNFAPLPGSGRTRPPVLAPPPPAQQFVFQPQQQFFPPPRPPPPLQQQQQQQHRGRPVHHQPLPHSIPVTFVNQAIPPKKAGAKGTPRLLLPKA